MIRANSSPVPTVNWIRLAYIHESGDAISEGFVAAQRGFELLNPETQPAPGKGLTANSGAIGA
jgi:hypothetical protein